MSRRWVPGVPDLVFGLVLAATLIGGRYRLLNDPGTLWHLRLGRDILANGAIPRLDTLSFSKGGQPWVDQSWLFDVGLAWLVDQGGWSTTCVVFALIIASTYALLARGLLLDGRSPMPVLVVAIFATGIGAIHFLIRPLVFTLLFVFLTLRLCQRQHERGGRTVYLVPLLTIVWANLHGGFLAGPFIVFSSGVGHAISGPWDSTRKKQLGVFGLAGVLCLIAALINPFGLDLFRHVGRLLISSGVTELIQEYQPIPFGKPDMRVYEWILIAWLAVPSFALGRMTRYELTQSLVWLHFSLASVRNAPLFALAVAPGLARLLDSLPFGKTEGARPKGLAEWSYWPAIAATGLGIALASGANLGGFDPSHWPLAGLNALNKEATSLPLFHEQDWGGMISAESLPVRKVYLDDRFELYGKPFILRYLNALAGGPDWDAVRDQESIGLVWIRPDRDLARRLKEDPRWRVVHQDAVSVLFRRIGEPIRRPEVTGEPYRVPLTTGLTFAARHSILEGGSDSRQDQRLRTIRRVDTSSGSRFGAVIPVSSSQEMGMVALTGHSICFSNR